MKKTQRSSHLHFSKRPTPAMIQKKRDREFDIKWFREGILEGIDSIRIDEKKAYKGEISVLVPLRSCDLIYDWCCEALGPPGRNHKYKWRRNNVKHWQFFFRDQAALTMFRLRWSNTEL
jgi:hypothetical protein